MANHPHRRRARTIDIDSHNYVSTVCGRWWNVYRLNGNWTLISTMCGTEAEARARASQQKPSDVQIMDDDARARDRLIRSENGLGVNDRW